MKPTYFEIARLGCVMERAPLLSPVGINRVYILPDGGGGDGAELPWHCHSLQELSRVARRALVGRGAAEKVVDYLQVSVFACVVKWRSAVCIEELDIATETANQIIELYVCVASGSQL